MMQFLSYRVGDRLRPGCRIDGRLVDLHRAALADSDTFDGVPADFTALLECAGGIARLAAAVDAYRDMPEVQVSDPNPEWGPPVPAPGKIICVGLNYPDGTGAERPVYPTLFLKAASTLTAPGSCVILPRAARSVFCEGELVLVIGRRCRYVPAEMAWEAVAGITIANDIGAEDLEARTSQWQTGKLPDTFLPMGPWMVPVDPAVPPGDLRIRVAVNGRPVLTGSTAEMFFSPEILVHYISGITTLHPGDLILTGSPKRLDGAAAGRATIHAGDVLRIDIERIGVLENPVEEEEVEIG